MDKILYLPSIDISMGHNTDMHNGNNPIKIGHLCVDLTPKLSRGQVPIAMLLRPPHTSILACVVIAISTKTVKSFRLSSSPLLLESRASSSLGDPPSDTFFDAAWLHLFFPKPPPAISHCLLDAPSHPCLKVAFHICMPALPNCTSVNILEAGLCLHSRSLSQCRQLTGKGSQELFWWVSAGKNLRKILVPLRHYKAKDKIRS